NESNTNDPPGTESTREQENDPDSSHDRESSVEYKEGPPQGIPQDKFEEGAELIRQRVSHISDDIAAHGSRARGTARPDSDVDISIALRNGPFDDTLHVNALLMPLSDYIYCKIFAAKANEQEVREIASSALGACFQGKFLEVSDILVEVSRNPDSHGDRNFDEDFIYWPTLIELELENHSHFPILARKTSLLLSTLWGASLPSIAA